MKQVFHPVELPTTYARKIAVACKLLPVKSTPSTISNYEDCETALAMFQQSAIASDFDKCLSIYEFDRKLTKVQKEKLQYIYDHTRDWIKGHIAGELLKKLSYKGTTGKDANEIAKTLNELLTNNSVAPSDLQGLVIRMASKT